MTPAAEVSKLDRQLSQHGQTVALKRGSGTARTGKVFVRGYDIQYVVGLITLADRKVICSPTDFGADLPRAQDAYLSLGKSGVVQEVEPIYMADTLVRIEMRVRMT